MNNDELPINKKEIPKAILAAVVEISAKQDALFYLIRDYLIK